MDRFVVDSPAEFERIRSLLGSFPPELLERVTLHTAARPLFEAHDVEREIERALHRKVWLRSGGYLVFDRTEAATVIDVNTGKYVGKTDQPSTILRTNLEAAAEVARQIRLRDIGGIILIDFIDMESEKHRRRVVAALEEAVKADRTKIHIIDLTGLGLVELTRKRVYQSLDEIMRIPCPYCEGRGRVLSPQSMAVRVRRELARAARASRAPCLVAEVHPEVAAILAGDARWTDTISRESGKTIFVRSRPGAHLERMDLLAGDSVEAAAIAVASAGNGRGAVDGWLDPARGEVLDVPDGDDGDPWPAPDPGGKRGILGRLRSWWGGRFAARRMGALRRERTHATHAGGR